MNRERYTGIWYNRLFRKITVNIHNRISKNGGSIVNDVDRIRVVRRCKTEDLIL